MTLMEEKMRRKVDDKAHEEGGKKRRGHAGGQTELDKWRRDGDGRGRLTGAVCGH